MTLHGLDYSFASSFDRETDLRTRKREDPEQKQKAFEDITRVDRNKWSPTLVDLDWSSLCRPLHDRVDQED